MDAHRYANTSFSNMKFITEGTPMWKNETDEALYLTADGQTVKEGDPKANSLLVAAGGELPSAEAEKYGLLKTAPKPEPFQDEGEEEEAEPTKAKDASPGTKALSFPPANKSK